MIPSFAHRALHVRTAGDGPSVVCLHSSAGSSAQWARLIELGQRRFRFTAVDFIGHGRSAPHVADPDRPYRLDTEAAAVAAVIDRSAGPVHLVGHSYGGAVALALALSHAPRIASVTVYEPVLFGILDRGSAEYREIAATGQSIARHARSGEVARAARLFIDYWSGPGSWEALAVEQRQRVEARILAVALHFDALFADPLPLAHLRALRVPVSVLHGDRSPAPAMAVCRALSALPAVQLQAFAGLAHMGPVTHAAIVDPYVLARLDRLYAAPQSYPAAA